MQNVLNLLKNLNKVHKANVLLLLIIFSSFLGLDFSLNPLKVLATSDNVIIEDFDNNELNEMSVGIDYNSEDPFINLFVAVFFFFVAFLFIFWIWMLIDCLTREFNDKLLWFLVIFFLNLFGAILYFFIVKNKKNK